MTKTATTILIILYLASSVGHASIEHYCHAKHEQSAHSGDCCCLLSCCGDAATLSVESPAFCCAADAHAEQNEKADEALFSGKCCENITSYHQIDESSTRESNLNVVSVSDESAIFLSPDLANWINHRSINFLTDPSFQLNLPLLN